MARRGTDEQIGLYFRRRQLGLRLLKHGARPQTILLWTGLTKDQLLTLRRRWAVDSRGRPRGPSPSSFEGFFAPARVNQQAALFMALCQLVGITKRRGKEAAETLPGVENGELLCEALEIFREWQPSAKLNFEQAALLVLGMVEEKAVRLTFCHSAGCGKAILVSAAQSDRTCCEECRRESVRKTG